MKISSLTFPVATAALLTAAFSIATVAQAPAPQQPGAGTATPPPPHVFPAPTNLKVLPKDLTGQQVHELMEGWEAALGAHCSTCHATDPKNIGPNGRPRLNFADDSKPEKSTARLMYKMVEDINKNYVSMIDSSGAPVTCGTCHRGHLGPEPFVAPPETHDHDHDHAAPPAGGDKPAVPQ